MHIAYLVITLLAALATGYAATVNFVGAESVKVVADRVQVSRRWMVPLGTLLAAGAAGLLTGFAVPKLGTAAAIGLVLYFTCAVTAHLRVRDRQSVGMALLVVLDRLTPAERLAFVLHDVFGVPFADVATALDRPEAAAQQLASRGRRRVRDSPEPDADLGRQRRVVDAFFAASRDGDFDALLELLDPAVELRVDGGVQQAQASLVLHGAHVVAGHTATYARLYPSVRRALVNGAAGAVVAPRGRVFAVMAFTVTDGKIVQIDALLDSERLARLNLSIAPSTDAGQIESREDGGWQ